MKRHYNLYYLFLEDKLRNAMPEDRRKAIREILEAFFRAIWQMKRNSGLLEE